MGQSSNSGRDNVILALIDALGPKPPRPPENSLAALFLSQLPAKASSPALNYLSLAETLTPKPKPLEFPEKLLALDMMLANRGNAPGLLRPSLPGNSLAMNFLGSVPAPQRPATYVPTRRKTFFSFHYADVFRVNNVRNAFKVYNPPTSTNLTFFDSSLWESRKLEGDEALKRMIREGVQNTSVVCVLVGKDTWARPWVRFEIARSIVDRKGLLAIDINGLSHHVDRVPHARGENPLAYMAVGKLRDGTYRLFEKRVAFVTGGWQWGWYRYDKHMAAVELPRYLPDPAVDHVTPLERGTMRYDFVQQQGHKNIGGWIDLAAINAGR
ncbi:MAG: TIR domain-containing protein [Rhizobium sp.]